MTNRLEMALEQTGQLFIEMANEIRAMRADIEDLKILVYKHESTNVNLSNVFNSLYNTNGPSQGGTI